MVFQQTYKEIIATIGKKKYESFIRDKLPIKSQINRKFKDDDEYLFLQLSRAILSAQANWGKDEYEYKVKKLKAIFPIGCPPKIIKKFEMLPFYKGFKYIESVTNTRVQKPLTGNLFDIIQNLVKRSKGRTVGTFHLGMWLLL